MGSDIVICPMQQQHWPAVRAIYSEGIATGLATFETETPDWEKWNTTHIESCRSVATLAGDVVGWAALSRVSARPCYSGVAEVSVYVADRAKGQGIGQRLLQVLLEEATKAGFWMLQATIFAENVASLRLHERCGFRVVGRRQQIAQLHGIWHDTVLMEKRF